MANGVSVQGPYADLAVGEWIATNAVTQFGLLRRGTQNQTRDTVRALTGRESRTLADFLRDHASAYV